ncbi:hypothetical protein BU23DRAFT_553157 [Bimuria novae-zelandiae CBS 107.79]|uniref:Uncharacterized protein n=1 Tax=Bimuria novae-zelandiae CBS 107.79 TaxID=1447943 RepID=A0A6A5VM53_9PLEO|nr:hypothetical protein BU23DRAFT_553157 [Bimuria novae-zelandiae CBS 107.79]
MPTFKQVLEQNRKAAAEKARKRPAPAEDQHEAKPAKLARSVGGSFETVTTQDRSKSILPVGADIGRYSFGGTFYPGLPLDGNISFESVAPETRDALDLQMVPWFGYAEDSEPYQSMVNWSSLKNEEKVLRVPFLLEKTENKAISHAASVNTARPASQTDVALVRKPMMMPTGNHPFVISSSGKGAVNLVDSKGKIVATRDPRGGFGYMPEYNWTPETSVSGSFDSTASKATLVPINPTSKVMVPRNRIPLDHSRPYLNAEILFGLPGEQNDVTKVEDEDDDSKTVIADEDHLLEPASHPTPPNSSFQSQSSFAVSEVVNQQTSFEDVLVLRRQGDTSFTSPSTMPCSRGANMNDIAMSEKRANHLLDAHSRSEEIGMSIASRLERMMQSKISKAIKEAKGKRQKVVPPSPTDTAIGLRKYLLEQKEARLETGDDAATVEHELQWADWLVEATSCGVMHLKVPGCTCRPEIFLEEVDEDELWSAV